MIFLAGAAGGDVRCEPEDGGQGAVWEVSQLYRVTCQQLSNEKDYQLTPSPVSGFSTGTLQ